MSNFKIENVNFFRGFDVRNGQIDITESEYEDFLNDIYYDAVEICGISYDSGSGRALRLLDPVAFHCGLGDYESEIQSELEDAVDNEDESEIEWEDGKSPDELEALEEQEED